MSILQKLRFRKPKEPVTYGLGAALLSQRRESERPGGRRTAPPERETAAPTVTPVIQALEPVPPVAAAEPAPSAPAVEPPQPQHKRERGHGKQKKDAGKRHAIVRKKYRKSLLLTLFVIIPTILLGFYLTFVFSPMYISASYFALRSSDNSDLSAVQSFLTSTSSGTVMDAYIIQNHITSHDMLEKVAGRIDLRGHYADPGKDLYSRLKSNPTKEEMLAYWQWLVSVTFELDKGIISVEVKAYTPEMAKAINDVILFYSEELVNQMNTRAHEDAIRLARDELEMAEQRVLKAQAALQRFRDDKSILDPAATAKGLESVIASLESEAASLQAELNAALEVMHRNSPRAVTLQNKLNALQMQIAQEKTRLAGLNSGNTTLSSLVGDYTQLVTEEQFAQDQLVRSMGSLEIARLKAIAKSRYIVPFQPPTVPEESLYPRPLLFTVFGFFAFLILLGITSLILAAIKDHMGV